MTEPRSLQAPPIDEVICGFRYVPIPSFSGPEHGRYWAERERDFPTAEPKDPVFDAQPSMIPEAVIRTWLVSADGNHLVQLQFDRFHANWRRRKPSDPYPHFKDRDGTRGIGTFAIQEYRRLQDFLSRRLSAPTITHAELTKVDLLYKGVHWDDDKELPTLIPILKGSEISPWGMSADFNLKFVQGDERHKEWLTLATGTHKVTSQKVIRIEHRSLAESDADSAEASLWSLNERSNKLFFSILAEPLLARLDK